MTQIGTSARSKEAPRHVSGRGRYLDDLTLPRMLHACVLRSPYAHARIVSVRAPSVPVAGNLQVSGAPLRGILTPDDVKQLSRPFKPGRYAAGLRVPIPEYAGAIGKVRYVGEPIAMVAADTRPRAEDALERREVEYDPPPAIVSTGDAARASAPLIYDDPGR